MPAALTRGALLALLCAAAPAAAQRVEIPIERIALSNEAAPGLPEGVRFARFDEPIANALGEVAVRATTSTGRRGIWRLDASGALALEVAEGEPAPGLRVGSFTGLGPPALNDRGQLAFLAGGTPATSLWLRDSAGGLWLLAREGAQAPGAPAGVRFRSFTEPLGLGWRGYASVLGSVDGPGVDGAFGDDGIWGSESFDLIAREGDRSAGGGSLTLTLGVGPPQQFSLYGVAYRSLFANLGGPTYAGIFHTESVGPIAWTGGPVRDFAGGVFASLSDPVAHENSLVAFHATLADGTVGIWGTTSPGRTGADLVARAGQAAPGPATASLFVDVGPPVVGGGEYVAFAGTAAGGGRTVAGAWLWSRQLGLQAALLGNHPAPGLPQGYDFGVPSVAALSRRGDALLSVAAKRAAGAAPEIAALYYRAFQGAPVLVLRAGQPLEVAPGAMRRVAGFSLAARSTGRYALGDAGDVALRVRFADGSEGLYVARVPAAPEDDADGDRVRDVLDNCPYLANPDQRDRERDGLGDACTPLVDADGDEHIDAVDNCPDHPNWHQEDLDADGIGDACNDSVDGDGDEWRDEVDDCRAVPNDQADLDRDGIGDACDAFPDEPDHEKAELRASLGPVQHALGLAVADLGRTREALDAARSELAATDAELGAVVTATAAARSESPRVRAESEVLAAELAECRERPLFADADGDGEGDARDACDATPPGVGVDGAGCSLAQHCAAIRGGPAACRAADWSNDEPLGNSGDCAWSRGACRAR